MYTYYVASSLVGQSTSRYSSGPRPERYLAWGMGRIMRAVGALRHHARDSFD